MANAAFKAMGEGNIESTVKIDEWVKASDGRWWYKHADGSYTKSNWEKINGKWYYFDGSGWMKAGWQKWKNKWYYLESSGTMAENKTLTIKSSKCGNEKYSFSSDGHMEEINNRGALVYIE